MANVTIYLNELGEPFIDLINEAGNVTRTGLDEDMAEAIGLIRTEQGYEVNGEEYSIPHEEANDPTNAATARATMPINVQETTTENGPKCSGNGNVVRKPWTEREIKCMLVSYQKHEELMKGTSVRNDSVWEKIAQDMKDNAFDLTGRQCKFKFQKLKQKFTRIRDNNSKTGAAPMTWSLLDDFEQMFGRDHNVQPPAIADSLNYIPLQEGPDVTQEYVHTENGEETIALGPSTSRRRKLPIGECLLKHLTEASQERIKRREKSDEEKRIFREQQIRAQKEVAEAMKDATAALREATKAYTDTMSKLLDKL